MGEPKWELGRAPCCELGSVWLVSVSTGHLAKACPERKEFLQAWVEKQLGTGGLGGDYNETNLLSLCRLWQP